jgi:L-ascorbate metabolism protein UlaG (beta-lactamase superfamily)
MDLHFYGANCISLNTKHARVIVDDNLTDLGSKSVTKDNDIVIFTGPHAANIRNPRLVIDQPGEYEVGGVSVFGIAATAHIDEPGVQNATIYKIVADDLSVLVTGHIAPDLSDDQLESIGMIDIMFVPVGGNGYTLDPIGALKLIKKVEPKMVIPTYYEDASISMPVPAQTLDQALQSLAMEPKERTSKLKLKSTDLPDTMQLIVLERA